MQGVTAFSVGGPRSKCQRSGLTTVLVWVPVAVSIYFACNTQKHLTLEGHSHNCARLYPSKAVALSDRYPEAVVEVKAHLHHCARLDFSESLHFCAAPRSSCPNLSSPFHYFLSSLECITSPYTFHTLPAVVGYLRHSPSSPPPFPPPSPPGPPSPAPPPKACSRLKTLDA